MVLALAGDSTMTKPLDNVPSNVTNYVLTLARMSSGCQVTARKAMSFELRVTSIECAFTSSLMIWRSALVRSTFVGVRRLGESTFRSPSPPENEDPAPTECDTRSHLPIRARSEGIGTSRHQNAGRSLPLCSLQLKQPSDGVGLSIRTFPLWESLPSADTSATSFRAPSAILSTV